MATEEKQDWESLGIAIERILGEPADAYAAFLQFAWLSGAERTTNKVAEITGFALSTVRMWSTSFDWVDRAAVVDGIKWTHEFKKRQAILEKDTLEFADANRKLKTEGLAAAHKMIATANRLLEKAEVVDEVIETGMVETKDGRMVPTTTEIHMKSKISDIPRLVSTAVTVGRLVQDLPTEIIEDRVPIGADLSNLSVEELLELQERNRAEMRAKNTASKIAPATDAVN